MRAHARKLVEEEVTVMTVKDIMQAQIHRVLVVESRRGKDAFVGLTSLLDLVALLASDERDG